MPEQPHNCDAGVEEILCPCGGTVIIRCAVCRRPLEAFRAPETTEPCEHGLSLDWLA